MFNKKTTITAYWCPKCKKSVYFRSNIDEMYTRCKTCGTNMEYQYTHEYRPKSSAKLVQNNHYSNKVTRSNFVGKDINTPKCPKCGSTAISTGARGVNNFWGFLGASQTVNRCANCGHTWKPRG